MADDQDRPETGHDDEKPKPQDRERPGDRDRERDPKAGPKPPEPAPQDKGRKREDLPEDTPDEVRDRFARMEAQLKAANKEAAQARSRLTDYERAEKEAEDKKLPEQERVNKRLKDAESRAADAERRAETAESALTQERLDRAIEREALKAGAEYPEDWPRLVDRTLIVEEDGKFDGLRKAVERLAKDRPGFLKPAHRPGGSPPPGGGGNGRQYVQQPTQGQQRDEVAASVRKVVNTSPM